MNEKPIKGLLLIEDNPGDARLLHEMLKEQNVHNIELTHVEYMRDAEKHLAERAVDIILLDLGLPDVQGLDAVRRAHAAAPRVPLVILSGLDDETTALQAMQEGAQDYLVKGQIEPRELLRALRYAVERKLIEETLWAEKERAQVTLDCIGDAVICTDNAGNVTFLNRIAEKMTGWARHEALCRPIAEVFNIVDGLGCKAILNPVDGAGEQSTPVSSDRTLIRRDGVEVAIEDSASPIHDREGHAIGAVIVFRDVSAARALSQQMAHSAEHDFLTGLPNRMLMNDRITQAITLAHRNNKGVAVLYVDLDGFKTINDSLGHSIGDKLLQSVAKRLRSCVRLSDTVSRHGGDEFLVLLSELAHSEDAGISARRMLEAVAEIHCIDDNDLQVTTSIGMSVYPDDGADADTLIKNADIAMYMVKESGRQGCRFFKQPSAIRAVEIQIASDNDLTHSQISTA